MPLLLFLGGTAIAGFSLFAGSQIDDIIEQPGTNINTGIAGGVFGNPLQSVLVYGGLGYLAFIGGKQILKKVK